MQSTPPDILTHSSSHTGMWRRLCFVVGMVLLVQVVGGIVTASSVTSWYPTLSKPSWNPPAWVFGPVWTVLYALMAWSGWRIWQRLLVQGVLHPWSHSSLRAFGLQLILNLGWSCMFFGLQWPHVAVLEMLMLFAAILWMLRAFLRVDRLAFYSQLPYALWVAFAFTLNAGIAVLNR